MTFFFIEKHFSHCGHLYGFSPVCIHPNALSHRSHRNGFSPEWVLSWIFRYEFCVLAFKWFFICLFKLDSWKNTFLHWTHSKGFLLLWVLMCRLKLDGPEKDLFHWRHLNCLSPTKSFLDELLWWIVLNKDVLSPGTSIPASSAIIMVSTSIADTFSDSKGVLSMLSEHYD